ncbi:MAG: glycosyltransferase [Muribaculaceae bacterium]|nr:glycosyltransferase [Muribaculaceae bacterium]
MIPKKIHYCWFGGNPLPEDARRCIDSWRRYMPDYEIVEWNESNFDVNSIPYTAQAYAAGKYAFVSDYARFVVLYEHGGVYFDTDVEVIQPMDDIIASGPFMGYEADPHDGEFGTVAPGLGLAAEKSMPIYGDIIEYYKTIDYCDAEGKPYPGTVVYHNTEVLKRNGLKPVPGIQRVAGITIYPQEFFCPLDDATGKLNKTRNTRTIHWYSKTWVGQSSLRTWMSRMSHRIFGTEFPNKVKNFLKIR